MENSRRHIAVLVIDDSDTILKVVGEMLYDGEYQAFLARSMDAALNINLRDQVDVILVDIVMPEMDGIELARRAVAVDPAIRIMFITGFAAVALRNRQTSQSDAKVLSKPFHLRDLVDEIDKTLAA